MHGRVRHIWLNIESPYFTDEEKGEAIRHVLDLEKHNGIKKVDILKACEYLWNKIFEVEK